MHAHERRKASTIWMFGWFHLLARKAGTVFDYLRMGFSLGKDLRSKILLCTFLPYYKLITKSYSVYTIYLNNYSVPIRLRAGDISEIHEILWREDYRFKEMEGADFPVVLDLGAHIGLFTLWIKHRFPTSTVHCYEPDPYSYSLLQNNTKFLNNVFLHPEGVGSSSGEATFFIDRRRHALSSFRESPDKEPISCSIKALDDVIGALGSVDLIKFDIEGLEYQVFSNSSTVQYVNHLVGEVHGHAVDVNQFLSLFPNHRKHIKSYSNEMNIVYLHRVAKGTCGSSCSPLPSPGP
jgi:FkbM family methyltransferase